MNHNLKKQRGVQEGFLSFLNTVAGFVKGAFRFRWICFISLLAFSLVLLLSIHSRAVSDDLRHTIVAEGNISHHGVRNFWHEGLPGYWRVVKSDARSNGRVRPMHWVHHHIPFLITLLRNGDLVYNDPDVQRSNRVNGCLQTHTYYQMFCVAVMLASLGWVIWQVTGVGLAGCLFVLLAAGGGMCLRQNIIVNFCDSGEIGQMMYISLYLVALLPALKGLALSRLREFLAVAVLLLAYAMKETTIILLPAVSLALLINLSPRINCDRAYLFLCVRHICFHVILASVMLFFVWQSRSGAYVSQNYEIKMTNMVSISRAWKLLGCPKDLTAMLIVGSILFFAVLFFAPGKYSDSKRQKTKPLLGVVSLFGVAAVGFWAVNIPWQEVSRKYFINSYLFGCALVAVFVVVPALYFRQNSLKYAYWLWVTGSVFFVLRHVPQQYENIEAYYRDHYGYRHTASAITENIEHIMAEESLDTLKVLIVTRRMFPEGPLTFWRQLNREHGLNIARDGKSVTMLSSGELNYFRRYEGASSVELKSVLSLKVIPPVDAVYFIVDPSEDEVNLLDSAGFHESWRRQTGSPAFLVRRFSREGVL